MSEIARSGETGVYRFPWSLHLGPCGMIWTFVANARSGQWKDGDRLVNNEVTWSTEANEKYRSWALGYVRGRRWIGIGLMLPW